MLMRRRTLCLLGVVSSLLFVLLQYRLFMLHDSGGSSPPLEFQSYNTVPTETQQSSNFCSKIPRGVTAASIWLANKRKIAQALRHPRDEAFVHKNWTEKLVDLLTPFVLEKSLKSSPHFKILEPLAAKLHERLRNPESAPPLKILVFGGSILEGSGCERSPIPGRGKLNFASLQECAWPFRWQMLMNSIHLFGRNMNIENLVEIHNLAVGGTHSAAAIPVLEYWLSPVFAPQGADVVINSYAANDNLPPAFHGAKNTTLDQFHLYRILERNRQFVKAAEKSSCSASSSPPLVLFVNDYLGNQQESIWGEGSLDEAVQLLADHSANIGYISAAHMVRHWALADTSETFFSGQWKDRKGREAINVHFGMAGHVTTLLAVTYGLLKLVLDYCEQACDQAIQQQVPPSRLDNFHIDLPTKEWVQAHRPATIIPNITQQSWISTAVQATQGRPQTIQEAPRLSSSCHPYGSPCAFAFLAAPLGTHQGQDKLAQFLKPYTLMVQNASWEAQNNFRQGGFQNKLGLVAVQPHAYMMLGISQLAQPVRIVTMHYLKSYGSFWTDSRARFRIEISMAGKQEQTQIIHQESFELEGFHNQSASITYFHRVELQKNAPIGSSIRFHMELVDGQTFKINALMFCSR